MPNKILGVNDRYYPAQNEGVIEGVIERDYEYVIIPTRAVLVEGDIGDYACYVGHGSPEWVAKMGNKISFEEAQIHFPGKQLKRELYRD